MKMLGLAAALLAGSLSPGLCSGYDDLNAGIQLHNSGRWDDAIAAFDKALATKDLNTDQQYIAHLDRARAREAKGDLDGALADFTACVGLRPGDIGALSTRATFYFNTNKPEEARQDIDAILAIDPKNDGAVAFRAQTYEMQGNAGKELQDLQAYQALNPTDKTILANLGVANFQLGKSDEAVKLFARASSSHPEYLWLWTAMADLKQGKPVPADSPFSLDHTKWPGPVIDFFQGRSTEDAVNIAAAKGDAKTARGQVCEANFYLGEWRLLHGDRPGAKPLFQKSASNCPRDFVEWPWALAELSNVPQQ
jgi:tetratricopeptide (TPR) repeat protein